MSNIKNIIFDLGGVLLNIDFKRTFAAFEALGVKNIEEMYGQHHASDLFKKLETGSISNDDFRKAIKSFIPVQVTDEQVDAAWNAMILDFRMESLAALDKLSQKYSLFLLSNTNNIHMECFAKLFIEETGKPLLDDYFSKCWYSHIINLRKPDKDIYEFVLRDAGIEAAETLFIDDTSDNIEAANKLGIKAHLLLPHEKIEELGL